MTTNWSETFKELFPEAYANSKGHYWWQELNLLYDRQYQNPFRVPDELSYWVRESGIWEKRTDEYGVETYKRIQRIITMLIAEKLEVT